MEVTQIEIGQFGEEEKLLRLQHHINDSILQSLSIPPSLHLSEPQMEAIEAHENYLEMRESFYLPSVYFLPLPLFSPFLFLILALPLNGEEHLRGRRNWELRSLLRSVSPLWKY